MSKFMNKVKTGLSEIGKKTGQTVEISKIRMEISQHRGTIGKETQALGTALLALYEEGQFQVDLRSGPFEKPFREIEYHKLKIKDLEERIGEVRERK